MIGPILERFILTGEARPMTIPMSLSGLVSVKLDKKLPFILTDIYIHPFFDLNAVDLNGDVGPPVVLPLTDAEKAYHGFHYYEFTNVKRVFGLLHRSPLYFINEGTALAPKNVPISQNGPTHYSVYCVFSAGGFLTMRVMRVPNPKEGGITVGIPPAEESLETIGYAAGLPVVTAGATYGIAANRYVPDERRNTAGGGLVDKGRPMPVTVNSIIHTANAGTTIMGSYSFPAVNLVGYQITNADLLKGI